MNHSRLAILMVCACLGGPAANAQGPGQTATRCDAILTGEEAAAIVGAEFQGPAVMEPRPGFTACDWQSSDANFGFTFTSTSALQADYNTAEERFEIDLVAVEESPNAKKREILANVGLKAARVALGDDVFLVEVQRADGVARMTFYKIAEDKLLALARAVTVP